MDLWENLLPTKLQSVDQSKAKLVNGKVSNRAEKDIQFTLNCISCLKKARRSHDIRELQIKQNIGNWVNFQQCKSFIDYSNQIFYIIMEENQVDTSQINLRNKGTKLHAGKVHKGCVKDAFTKLSIGSIPSNYQSIIYHHQQKRGFGTSQKRFNSIENRSDLMKVDTDSRVTQSEPHEVHNVSESTKGYGPFIAKQKRAWFKLTHSPGPGKYFNKRLEKIDHGKSKQNRKRKCYTGERQDLKRRQLFQKKEIPDLPGPGYYEPADLNKQLVGCKSSFINKLKRQAYIPKSQTPGPGCYIAKEVSESLSNQKKRQILQDEYFTKMIKEKRPKSKLFIERPINKDIPGPGFYDAEIPSFKPLYQRIKISNNFMQSSKDRFNDQIDKVREDVSLSPCSYDLHSSFDKVEKKLIDMPCFLSESRREPFTGVGLGPSVFYETNKQRKANFHFNIRGQWV